MIVATRSSTVVCSQVCLSWQNKLCPRGLTELWTDDYGSQELRKIEKHEANYGLVLSAETVSEKNSSNCQEPSSTV